MENGNRDNLDTEENSKSDNSRKNETKENKQTKTQKQKQNQKDYTLYISLEKMFWEYHNPSIKYLWYFVSFLYKL